MQLTKRDNKLVNVKSAKGIIVAFLTAIACAFLSLGLPPQAQAEQVRQVADGTMSITLASSVEEQTSTVSETASGLSSATGDPLFWIIASFAIIFSVLGIYLLATRKRVSTSSGSHASQQNINPSKVEKTSLVIASIMIMCLGVYLVSSLAKESTYADDEQTWIVAGSEIVVDEEGTVLSNSLYATNGTSRALQIEAVTAPEEMQEWQSEIVGQSLGVGSDIKGTWDGQKVPSSVVDELKANGGQITKHFSITFFYEVADSESEVLTLPEPTVDLTDKVYKSEQWKPAVTIEGLTENVDYTVTYGENVKVGTGTVVVTGKGEYTGSSTLTFKIVPKEVKVPSGIVARDKVYDGTVTATVDYTNAVLDGKIDGDSLSATATGAFPDKNAEDDKEVKLVDLALTGDDVANYELASSGNQESATATINPKEIGLLWGNSEFTYNKTKQAPEATATDLIEGDEVNVTVSGEQIHAGVYDATATKLDNSNYKLPADVTWSFSILRKSVVISGITAEDKEYDGTIDATLVFDDVVIDGLEDGDDLGVTATGRFETPGKGIDKKVILSDLTLTGDDISDYKLAETGQQTETTASITAFYTVTFNSDGGTEVSSQRVKDGDCATKPDDPKKDNMSFDGWYEDGATEEFDFSTPITKDTTLVANWKERGVYWLAPADATDPEGEMIKTQSQIQKDVAVLRDGGTNYDSVLAEYQGYLSSDATHLYTKWNGSTADSAGDSDANGYVEFRIMQVGAHDGDGSVLTFMATHTLPQAYQMRDDDTYDGGWASDKTTLRNQLQPSASSTDDTIYNKFDKGFTDDIKEVTKYTGIGTSKTEMATSVDKFWLLSFCELTGKDEPSFVPDVGLEGSKYAFLTSWDINCYSRNDVLCLTTRSGNAPADASTTSKSGANGWWQRSPMYDWYGYFLTVDYQGQPNLNNKATVKMGVAPAFCF